MPSRLSNPGIEGKPMSAYCCERQTPVNLARYRQVLWIALLVNAAMFGLEIAAGLQAGSLSLLADAIDFAGDANMRSVWLCTRNDAIGNLAVMAAALGVFGTGTTWPDLLVASLMATLALYGGWQVMRQARRELKTGEAVADDPYGGHGHVH